MSARDLGERLPLLVERLVASYLSDARTQHIDRRHLPSKERMMRICELLLELTFPGYFGRKGLTRHNISYHVGELLPQLWDLLVEQISSCLAHEGIIEEQPHRADLPIAAPDALPAPAVSASTAHAATASAANAVTPAPSADELRAIRDRLDACHTDAAQLADTFLEQIPAVRTALGDDVQAAFDGDPAATTFAEIILAYPSLIAICLHRYAHLLYQMQVPLMPRVISERAHQLTAIDIHPGAAIGRCFFIDHGTGVVIGETTRIGEHVKIYQGVTLGALSFPRDARGRIIKGQKRHPTVGNQVTIYANAIVLGGDTVLGDGCIIGGSVFLTQSVAAGHQVSISPPVLKVRPPRP